MNSVIPAQAHCCPGKILPVFGKPCVARFLNETSDFRLKFFKFPERSRRAKKNSIKSMRLRPWFILSVAEGLSHLDSIKLFPRALMRAGGNLENHVLMHGSGRFPIKLGMTNPCVGNDVPMYRKPITPLN